MRLVRETLRNPSLGNLSFCFKDHYDLIKNYVFRAFNKIHHWKKVRSFSRARSTEAAPAVWWKRKLEEWGKRLGQLRRGRKSSKRIALNDANAESHLELRSLCWSLMLSMRSSNPSCRFDHHALCRYLSIVLYAYPPPLSVGLFPILALPLRTLLIGPCLPKCILLT